MRIIIIFLLFLISIKSNSKVQRIIKKTLHSSKVETLFVSQGKPLHIEFPCEIHYALPGTKTDLEIKVGIKNKNTLSIWAHSNTKLIGLNVKCSEHLLVFDIYPSRDKYQSYIKYERIMALNEENIDKNRRLLRHSESVLKTKSIKRKLILKSSDLKPRIIK